MRPGKNLIIALLVWLGLGVLAVLLRLAEHLTGSDWLFGEMSAVWALAGIGIGVAALLEPLSLLRHRRLEVSRDVASSMAVGVAGTVAIKISNQGRSNCTLLVFDHYPNDFVSDDTAERFSIEAGKYAIYQYQMKPLVRGDGRFGPVEIIINSVLGLWQWSRKFPVENVTKVYPNFANIKQFTLLSGENQLGQMGIRLMQRRGEGLEFHQLREYRRGDSLRQIDWRATSRLRKLISREYQEERDQQIIFLLDCGRRMRTQDGALSHFDHTLNAVLLLSYVALKQGDAVGFMAFGGPQRWLKPVKGAHQVNTLLNQVYDLHPTNRASDYIKAAQDLSVLHKKRALVVLASNLRDDDISELDPAVSLLSRHHLLLMANLREALLDETVQAEVEDFKQALRYGETAHYAQQRARLTEYFSNKGVVTLDCRPDLLPSYMVNKYFEIKRQGRL